MEPRPHVPPVRRASQDDNAPTPVTYAIECHGDVTLVRFELERLDAASAAEVRELLTGMVRSGHHRVVLDLAPVSFLDSAGLGALVAVLKRLRSIRDRRAVSRPEPPRRPSVRGDLRLAGLQPPVRSLLEIIRLDRVFSTFATTDEALQSFRPRS